MCKLYWQLVRQSQNTSGKINNVRVDEQPKKGKSSRDKRQVPLCTEVRRWGPDYPLAIFALFALWSANNANVCRGYHWYPRLCIMKIKRCFIDRITTCDWQKVQNIKKITRDIQLSIYFLPSICLDLSLICAFHSRIWRVSLLRPLYSLAISLFTFHYSDSKSGRPSPSQFCVRCPTPSAQNGIFSHADRTHVINVDASK